MVCTGVKKKKSKVDISLFFTGGKMADIDLGSTQVKNGKHRLGLHQVKKADIDQIRTRVNKIKTGLVYN